MAVLTKGQERRLEELRRNYQTALPTRVRELVAAVEAAFSTGDGKPAARVGPLQYEAHRLCGSAAIFGFVEVSAAARRLEDLLSTAAGTGADADRRRRAILCELSVLRSLLPDRNAADHEASAAVPSPDMRRSS